MKTFAHRTRRRLHQHLELGTHLREVQHHPLSTPDATAATPAAAAPDSWSPTCEQVWHWPTQLRPRPDGLTDDGYFW
ncbi:hypothetical protein I546_0570 [Mycobacterium kansasii 732]|nr:hypothetical protein I546_0570 [Mycobacterium kansasii 732]